jgi:hypothetical protein
MEESKLVAQVVVSLHLAVAAPFVRDIFRGFSRARQLLQKSEVTWLLPLGPNQVVLSKVFAHLVSHFANRVVILVVDYSAMHVPPPATVLKDPINQLRVVSFSQEGVVVLKVLSLKVQLYSVALIYDVKKCR